MELLDYIVIFIYFLGLIAVSVVMSRKIKNSEDMFIAGRNSSWWLSGVSSYMTIFSASTFVVWGGVAYKSGLVAVVGYFVLVIAYAVVTSHVYNRNHRQARQRVKKYNHNLTRLLKMYEKERK